MKVDLNTLKATVTSHAAAFRCVTDLQPVGGTGDKVFPATYEGGRYASEKRRIPGEVELVDCVLLDSVQSQANRMELALLEAWRRKEIPLPVITVDFSGYHLEKEMRITSLEAPHRIADALLRDSYSGEKRFRESDIGKRLDHVDCLNATALFELCPTALIFGMWDSTGPKGGAGAKFARGFGFGNNWPPRRDRP
jgi:CRISPR-associated protein Csb1